jgi:hypothetical protein
MKPMKASSYKNPMKSSLHNADEEQFQQKLQEKWSSLSW